MRDRCAEHANRVRAAVVEGLEPADAPSSADWLLDKAPA